jgi:hypothetical protein
VEQGKMTTSGASRFPVPNPVSSFWNADPLPFDDLRSTVEIPSEADVVIIGAGFSGIASLTFEEVHVEWTWKGVLSALQCFL